MERNVSVRLRDTGQNFLYNSHDLEVKEGDYVIVEHDRGLDYGQIVSLKGEVEAAAAKQPVKKIIRLAKESDLKQIEDNRARSKEAFNTCQKKIAEHKLDMKLVQAEYSFDRSKIIFYFTSGGRVDFRNLVKDLAKIFKARIELRQIGVRDETKFFGGFGPCGRELCCASFLKDFEPVTIKMAKEEGLPLNPPKISGICGRLMCCLNYEYETYKALAKGLPREGERVVTKEGKGKVINVNVFKRAATVELEDGKLVEMVYADDQKAEYCERPAQVESPAQHEGQGRPSGQGPARPCVQRSERCERCERPQGDAPRPCGQTPAQPPAQRPGRNDRSGRNDRHGRQDRHDRNDRRPRPGQEDSPAQTDGQGRASAQGQARPGGQRPGGQSPAQGEAPGRSSDQPPAQRPDNNRPPV